MSYIVGTDIGGTFTDFVLYCRETEEVRFWKELTTPLDPIEAVMTGLKQVDDLDQVEKIRLGTTIATNALLTRRGAAVAYVTTRGFRDIPFIQRGDRRSHYDISWIKAKPFVERRHCYEINERLSARGEVIVPLDEAEVRELARTIKRESIEAVAVCLLFSYLNPENERRVSDLISEEIPGIPISISYDVLPKWKEYERASTTIADAFLKPVIAHHFDRMRERFKAADLGNRIGIIKSNGGEATLANAATTPVQLALSGPTGAVVATRALAKLTGIGNLVTFDMGGTSTDCSTVVDGQEHITTAFEIEWGIPIQIPMIDIHSIGAGGGSIAWVDKGGMLRVGPQSAGAAPGPACYGRGGVLPTVTDANVVLGYLNPVSLLDGGLEIDKAGAEAAIVKHIAEPLGLSAVQAAASIIEVVNANMCGALNIVSVERGHDPQEFSMIAFGGAGPIHAMALASELAIPKVIIPAAPGAFSALGLVATDIKRDYSRTLYSDLATLDLSRVEEMARSMEEEGMKMLEAANVPAERRSLLRFADVRYRRQAYELTVAMQDGPITAETLAALAQAFHRKHEQTYGHSNDKEAIQLVNLRLTALGKFPPLRLTQPSQPGAARYTEREVWFSKTGFIKTPVLWRDGLEVGEVIKGPTIIESLESTTVVPPEWLARVDGNGFLIAEEQSHAAT